MNPTDEQLSIIQSTRSSPASLRILAYAGCGKTTTLQLLGETIKSPALALAFNKSTANEFSKRFAGNFTTKTINSLGYGAWTRANPQVASWKLDANKTGKLVTQISKDRKLDLTSDQWDSARRLTSAAMQAGITPGDIGDPMAPDTEDSWLSLAEQLYLDPDDAALLLDIAHEALERDILEAKRGTISFDDQVYCPTVLGGKWAKFPVVLGDEAQDFSPLNHRILALSLRPDGRLIVCGDPKQSIYGFRGADHQSMDTLLGLRPDWQSLPLTLTYRCPHAIVERQQTHAPGFRAAAEAPEGQIKHVRNPEHTLCESWPGWTFTTIMESLPSPESSAAILCRNNGPLLGLAFKLIRRGIGPVMLGRDIGKGLVSLSRKISPDDNTPAASFASAILDWELHETSLARANDHEERIAGIVDRAECLRATLANSEARDAGTVRVLLERLFARESGQITLSSIHKAKGLEWDLVLHLDPWRIPAKQAKGNPAQMAQELNLRYVAETRSKHTLILANLADFR
jgi:superfamily I DNA/RNA helicase